MTSIDRLARMSEYLAGPLSSGHALGNRIPVVRTIDWSVGLRTERVGAPVNDDLRIFDTVRAVHSNQKKKRGCHRWAAPPFTIIAFVDKVQQRVLPIQQYSLQCCCLVTVNSGGPDSGFRCPHGRRNLMSRAGWQVVAVLETVFPDVDVFCCD